MPGRVNASARNRISGCFLVTAAMTSCQKRTGLVWGLSMRKIVTPALIHSSMNTLDFLLDAGHVGVEVDRVDVLILLRRVLREGDGAVRLVAEPVRVLLDPRVVGRALQREVERDFQTQLVGRWRQSALKSSMVPSSGSTVSCPPSSEPMPNGEPGSSGPAIQRVVASLAVRHADREDRRQVHDVEAFGLGAFQAGHRRLERALDDLAGLRVDVGALGTREELVPCGEAGLPDAARGNAGAGWARRRRAAGWSDAAGRPVRWSPRRDGPRA